MAKVNGRADCDFYADKIVSHILNESIVKHYGTRLSNEETNELREFTNGVLEEIIGITEAHRPTGDCSVRSLINELAEGKCKGVKGGTVHKITEFAAEMGLI